MSTRPRRLLRRWQKMCLSPKLREGPRDVRLRAELVVAFTSLFMASSLLLVATHLLAGSTRTALFVMLITACCGLILALLRVSGSLEAAGHLTGLFWCTMTIGGLTIRGGLHSPMTMACAGAPIVALFVGGRRAGLVWAGVTVCILVGFVGMHAANVQFSDWLPQDARPTVSAIAGILFTVVLLGAALGLDLVSRAEREERLETEAKLHRAELDQVRAESEAQLTHADRMASVGQLGAGIAHEINNPLAYIVGNLDFIEGELRSRGDYGDGDEELIAALEDARDGALRVAKIVQSLKLFTRRDEPEQRKLIDVRASVDDAIDLASPHTRHVASVTRDDDEVPCVLGDAHKLTQVFLNLVINAAQAVAARPNASESLGLIEVSVRSANGGVTVTVRDEGVGISAEHLHRVTEPFFTTKPVGVGTGLGLSVCSGIVDSHGGQLEIESEAGHGTTVRVTLPIAPEDAAAASRRSIHTAPDIPARLRILVVDDEPLVRKSLARQMPEHEVSLLGGGSDAIRALEDGAAFDVIFCDLMMPDKSGVDVYEFIKSTRPEWLERLVFVTGGACTPQAERLLARVENLRLRKPITRQQLLDAVASVVGAQRGT